MQNIDSKQIAEALRAPFDVSHIDWKPQGKGRNGKVRVVPYIDARLAMKRLSEVFGVNHWSDSYKVLVADDKIAVVECTIVAGGASHSDVGDCEIGGYTPNLGAALKGAYSDSLKRAAVHFGVGAYLYAMPEFYVDCDSNGHPVKGFQEKLKLPSFAIPVKKQTQNDTKSPPQPKQPEPEDSTSDDGDSKEWDDVIAYIDAMCSQCAEATGGDPESFETAAYKLLGKTKRGSAVSHKIVADLENYFAKFLDS